MIKNLCLNTMDQESQNKRKTRRGKKKMKKLIWLEEKSNQHSAEHSTEAETEEYAAGEVGQVPEARTEYDAVNRTHPYADVIDKKSKRRIRPTYNPRAPCNYTQFIIDDHVLSSGLYTSFGEDSFSNCKQTNELKQQPLFNLPIYSEEDVDYESPEDIDTVSFLQNDFESAFQSSREDELMERSKHMLVCDMYHMEAKIASLEKHVKVDVDKQSEDNSVQNVLSELEELRKLNHSLVTENTQLKQEMTNSYD